MYFAYITFHVSKIFNYLINIIFLRGSAALSHHVCLKEIKKKKRVAFPHPIFLPFPVVFIHPWRSELPTDLISLHTEELALALLVEQVQWQQIVVSFFRKCLYFIIENFHR